MSARRYSTPPATPASSQAIINAVNAALRQAIESALAPIVSAISVLKQRLTFLEAAIAEDAVDDDAIETSGLSPAMKRMRKELSALRRGINQTDLKLAKRFGSEFAPPPVNGFAKRGDVRAPLSTAQANTAQARERGYR